MRRKTAVLVLVLALVAVPALGAPATDAGSPWSWSELLPGFVWEVVEWVAGAGEVEPDGDDEGRGSLDPDGYQVSEPEPPEGEGRGWLDPNGITAAEPEPPEGEGRGSIDPNG